MNGVDLKVDWCSYEAAKYAVMHWHYSKTMPVARQSHVGVWENEEFIGAVVFSWGANPNIGKPYNLELGEVAECVRVALQQHVTPVSQIVSKAVKLLKRQSPGLRLLVSYADTREHHHGGIYQAMNWVYAGQTAAKFDYALNGQILQRRSYTGRNFNGTRLRVPLGAVKVRSPPKHRYLYPLDRAMRRQILPLAQPYPKRAGEVSKVTRPRPEEGAGSSPAARLMVTQ